MSVRTEAAPRKGRRRDRPSTEGSEPAKTKYLPHPEPKAEKRPEPKAATPEAQVEETPARERYRPDRPSMV